MGQGAVREGEAIAEALGREGKAAILMNHGLLSVGGTVDEAGFLFGLLERCCGIQLEVEKAGVGKKVIGDEEAEFNFRTASTPVRFCFSFPFYFLFVFFFFSFLPSIFFFLFFPPNVFPSSPSSPRRS